MAGYGISIAAAANSTAVIKVLRTYTTAPVLGLRDAIGTDMLVVLVEDANGPLELDAIESTQFQHEKFLAACRELREAGADIQMWYWAADEYKDAPDRVNDEQVRNLMASKLGYLRALEDRRL